MAKKKLSEYRAKRDFKKTAEPAGKTAIRSRGVSALRHPEA